jgi:hypothetical protein
MNIAIEPTIDDIRKMGNDRRPKITKPPAPKKITKKKVKEPEPIIEPEPEPEPEPLEEDEEEESESDEEVYIPPPKKNNKKDLKKGLKGSYTIQNFIKDPKNKDVDFELLFENITDIKNLIKQQQNTIEEVVKPKVEEPKSKPKPKPKPKVKKQIVPKGKSLDLTVSDKEVEQLISTNNTKPPPVDEKLQAFLNAFKR